MVVAMRYIAQCIRCVALSVYHIRTISVGRDHVNDPSYFANSASQPVPDKTLSRRALSISPRLS
jgi:hypothetical protein